MAASTYFQERGNAQYQVRVIERAGGRVLYVDYMGFEQEQSEANFFLQFEQSAGERFAGQVKG